jgi:hypothetical protein
VSRDLFYGNSGNGALIELGNGSIASKPLSNVGFVRGFDAKGCARARAHEAGPQPGPDAWRLEPHVCRSCFSRLVSCSTETRVLGAPPAGSTRLYQCTNCGLEATGAAPEVLCACGMKIRKTTRGGRSSVVLGDAGIRCMANPEIRADFASLFVAQEVGPRA